MPTVRTLLAPAVAALLVLGACTQDVEDPPGDGDDARGPTEVAPVACPAEVDEALRAWADAGFSGTVVVTEGGEATCEAAYGLADREAGVPATPETVYAIGSVSKAFTAAAVLDLVAAGDLDLDDRAGDLVAGLGGPAADATVEQLLLHTSGISGDAGPDHEPLDHDQAVAAIGALPQAAPPGTDFTYTNAGYTLLALIVEAVSGEPYREHLAATVLAVDGDAVGGFWDGEPAAEGPRAVGDDAQGAPSGEDGSFAGPHWALAGNGDLAMTAPELARWTAALFAGGVVAPEAIALLEATTFDQGDGTVEVPGWVRLDAARLGEPAYGVAGGGGDIGQDVVTAHLPDSDRVVTIASNGAEVSAEDLLVEIGPALLAGDPLPVPETAAPVDPEELAAAEGTYALDTDALDTDALDTDASSADADADGGGEVVVTATDEGLALAPAGAAAVAAVFPPADADDAAARRAHEERVVALLRGETAAGRDELETLEEDLGPITDVTVEGTVVADRELRTYVTLTADEEVLAWYAVDDSGGIQAVEITDEGPSRPVLSAGGGTFRSADGAEGAAPITVAVGADRLTLTGPDGAVAATRT